MGIKDTNTWKFQGGLKISRTWKNPGPLEISRAPGNFKVPWKIPGGSLISLRTSSAKLPTQLHEGQGELHLQGDPQVFLVQLALHRSDERNEG